MKPKNTEAGESRAAVESTAADSMTAERMASDRTSTDSTATGQMAADCTAAGGMGSDGTAAARTVENGKAKRRKSAIQGAVVTTVLHLVAVCILLWVRAGHDPASFLAKFTLVLAGFELIGVVPVWFSLKERFKEIEGGEEDAAAQY